MLGRVLRWIAVGAGVLIVCGYVYDEGLADGVEELLIAPPVTAVPEENGYFAFLGHSSDRERDPRAAGVELVSLIEAAVAEDRRAADETREDLFGPPGLGVDDGEGLLEGSPGGEDLAALAVEREDSAAALLEANGVLLERYRRLLDYPRFQETLPVPYLAESYPGIADSNRLYLLQAALLLKEGRTAEAAAMLNKNLAFWRMVLRESRHLEGSMTAVGRLRDTLNMLAGAVDRGMVAPAEAAPFETGLSPLTPEERDLTAEIERHHAEVLGRFSSMFDGFPWHSPARLVAKRNATLNYYYSMVERDRPLYALPSREYGAATKDRDRSGEGVGLSWFNVAGKSIADISYSNLIPFVDRVHVLEARFTLVRLRLALAGRGDGGDIGSALAAACPPSCNPLTGEPAAWDPAGGRMSFTLPAGSKIPPIEVPLTLR